METERLKELIKKYGYCISILDRPNGLVTLTLIWGIDHDKQKEFSKKANYHSLFIEATLWLLEQQPTDTTVYYLKQLIGDN